MLGRGSLTLFRVRGVPVRVHWTLLLVIPYLAFVFSAHFREVSSLAGIAPESVVLPPLIWGALVAVALFASIALHELGHTLVALRFGGVVRDITLMLLGGVSRFERLPRRPFVEALVSFVGPATSLVLAVILLGLNALVLPLPPDLRLGLFYLGHLNLALGLFNLVPAFPMDGGRVLRALLSVSFGPRRATDAAAYVGMVIAAGLGFLGLWGGNLLLLLVAAFVFAGARAEARMERFREALSGMRMADLLGDAPAAVSEDTSFSDVLTAMRQSGRLQAVVMDSKGRASGVVLASDLAAVPLHTRHAMRLSDLGDRLRGRMTVVAFDEPAVSALDRVLGSERPYLLVVDGQHEGKDVPLGLLSLRDLEEHVALRTMERGLTEPPRAPREA